MIGLLIIIDKPTLRDKVTKINCIEVGKNNMCNDYHCTTAINFKQNGLIGRHYMDVRYRVTAGDIRFNSSCM